MNAVDPAKPFVQYARDMGKIILSVLDAGGLPDGAQWDPQQAEKIAADGALLAASRNYWRARLNQWDLRADALNTALPPPFRFGHAAAADAAKQAFQLRKQLQNEPDYCASNPNCNASPRPQFFFTDPTCMVALDEIATQASLAVGSYPESQMWVDLQSFLQSSGAAQNDAEKFSIANGIRAARELDDLARRFNAAIAAAQEFNAPGELPADTLSFTEFLALHRQEGAMCITPSASSFPHAPLVLTEPGDCRTPSVILSTGRRRWRPGFNLGFDKPTITTLIGALSGTDLGSSLVMTKINFLVLGGLDNLVSWPLHNDDELSQLTGQIASSGATGARIDQDWPGLSAAEGVQLNSILLGTLMADIENRDDPGSFDARFNSNYTALLALVQAHRIEEHSSFIALVEDDAGISTSLCLRCSALWYASRCRPATLAARRDRALFMDLPRFSPFVTYLRYHLGDVLFMGVLIRLLNEFLKKAASLNGVLNDRAPDFASLSQDDPDSFAALKNNFSGTLLPFWLGVATESSDPKSVWRHIGLAQVVGASLPRPAQARSSAIADVAKQVLQAIQLHDLVDAINAALEFTPISKLMGLASFDDQRRRTDFAEAENFTRVYLCFEAARQDAMLSNVGQPL